MADAWKLEGEAAGRAEEADQDEKSGESDEGRGSGRAAGGRAGEGAAVLGPRPTYYSHQEILATLAQPVRRRLTWLLAVPLVALLLMVLRPWTYLPDTGDEGIADQGQGAPYDPATEDDGAGGDQETAPGEETTSTDEPTPTGESTNGTAVAQATEVDRILEESSGYRESVSTAVADATACGPQAGLTEDAADFQAAAVAREGLSTQVEGLAVDLIEQGPEVQRLLKEALDQSAAVDYDFATWARGLQDGGCLPDTATDAEPYRTAVADSAKASAAKEAFLVVWNPIAESHTLRTWQADQF
ncbi:hypothetical protein [Streptomyces sp. NPDC047097]|uniref:hypothetical protein n=1 Tax=Streptomyces sp. NPDC047097 TaxID=3155260 RepID=UPI0033C72F00